MTGYELMHQMFGKTEKGICWNCHFCHWKIAGKGNDKHIEYIWCEVYGINKDNMLETAWKFKNPACGLYNICKDPPKKQIWKLAKAEAEPEVPGQLSLF